MFRVEKNRIRVVARMTDFSNFFCESMARERSAIRHLHYQRNRLIRFKKSGGIRCAISPYGFRGYLTSSHNFAISTGAPPPCTAVHIALALASWPSP